jgi:hypothetical protein
MDWGKLAGLGADLVGAIIRYVTASAEEKQKLRDAAEKDELAFYDEVDNHLLDGNALVDAEADAKFGKRIVETSDLTAAASRDTAEAEQDAAATGTTAAHEPHAKDDEG